MTDKNDTLLEAFKAHFGKNNGVVVKDDKSLTMVIWDYEDDEDELTEPTTKGK